MKTCEKYIDFSCFLPLHILFYPCSWLDVSVLRGKKNPEKNLKTPTHHMGMASYFCALSCPVAIPSAWRLPWHNSLPCSTQTTKLPVLREWHAGLHRKGTLIKAGNFQFPLNVNLAVLPPAERNDNEAIDHKQVQRGAALGTANLRTPAPCSVSASWYHPEGVTE